MLWLIVAHLGYLLLGLARLLCCIQMAELQYWHVSIAITSHLVIIISGLPSMERSRFLIHEASGPLSRCLGPKLALWHGELLAAVQRKAHQRVRSPATCQAGVW